MYEWILPSQSQHCDQCSQSLMGTIPDILAARNPMIGHSVKSNPLAGRNAEVVAASAAAD